MSKTLQLVFMNQDGGRVTLSIPDPLEPVVVGDVEDAMDQILDADVIVSSGGGLVTKVRAVVVSRDVDELVVF